MPGNNKRPLTGSFVLYNVFGKLKAMKIFIVSPSNKFTDEQIDNLKKTGEVVFLENEHDFQLNKDIFLSGEKVFAIDPGIINWNFPNTLIDRIQNLHAICIPTTAYGWLDVKHLKDKGIILSNVPRYSTEAVAEYAISLLMNTVRKMALIVKNSWQPDLDQYLSVNIQGKTMAIIGLGDIGKRIAELGQALGMKIIYWSKQSRDDRFQYMEINDLLKTGDFIIPCLATNPETKNFMDYKKLDLLKYSSYIISVTGEELFDLDYATQLVSNGKLAGIGFESGKYSHGSYKLDDFKGNVWVTPPVAWYTEQSVSEDYRIWVENIISASKGNPINIVG